MRLLPRFIKLYKDVILRELETIPGFITSVRNLNNIRYPDVSVHGRLGSESAGHLSLRLQRKPEAKKGLSTRRRRREKACSSAIEKST